MLLANPAVRARRPRVRQFPECSDSREPLQGVAYLVVLDSAAQLAADLGRGDARSDLGEPEHGAGDWKDEAIVEKDRGVVAQSLIFALIHLMASIQFLLRYGIDLNSPVPTSVGGPIAEFACL